MSRPAGGVPRLEAIQLRDVSVRFGKHWALDRVSFELHAGERWLLQGPNGAGKTVFLKLLRGDVWPTPRGGEARTYRMSDGDVLEQAMGASERIAYLGPERQDRYGRIESTLTVAQVVLTGFDDSDFPLAPPSPAQAKRVAEMLSGIGLAGLASRKLLSLSYGQRRRVLLARALVRNPDVLLLDEALNGLDAAARRAFLKALQLTVPARTAWILSTHRRGDAPANTTHTARLERGRIVECMALPHSQRTESTTRRALANKNVGRALAHDGELALSNTEAGPALINARPPSVAGQSRAEPRALLTLRNATVFRDERRVIGEFDWTLLRGQHWQVTGANGSGKSTLIALLYGDLWPAYGAALMRGGRGVMPIEEWKQGTGLVSPELQATYSATGCTATEIVVSGLHSSIGLDAWPTPIELAAAELALQQWDIAALAARRAREMSYGQLRLVLVARAFIAARRLFLLDEPVDGMDAAARARFFLRLDSARKKGATVVMATHHAEDVPSWITNRLQMRAGRSPLISTGQSGSAAS